MYVRSLKLIGFRNYLEANLELPSGKIIIVGNNGQGKTNLLEVIQIFSHYRSRRASRDASLVNFSLKESIIKLEVVWNDNQEQELALLLRTSGRRSAKINGVSKTPLEITSYVYSVSFMVDDIEIINGAPAERRSWLDKILSQLTANGEKLSGYLYKLEKFEDILAQRNRFLKALAERGLYRRTELNSGIIEQLNIWDDLFIEASNKIYQQRKSFIQDLNPLANDFYKKISQSNDVLELIYQDEELNNTSLRDSLDKDLARACSNLGAHRAEVTIQLNGNLAKDFASQGERRSIALALKLAELELLKRCHNEYPILLLDDVLAELDEARQDFLLDAVPNDAQVIITTTHLGKHLEKWIGSAKVIKIEAGSIIF